MLLQEVRGPLRIRATPSRECILDQVLRQVDGSWPNFGMDFTKGLVICISDVYKGTHADESSGDAEGARKYNRTRTLRMTLEHFRALKSVSQVF